jgi:hypothetical protein
VARGSVTTVGFGQRSSRAATAHGVAQRERFSDDSARVTDHAAAGGGYAVSDVALADPRLAGIHFPGSTATFQRLWREVGANTEHCHSYGASRRRTG